MVHLMTKRPNTEHPTACGHREIGDRTTLRRQQCTCSVCQMHIEAHEAYLLTLAPRAYRDEEAIAGAKERGLIE